MMSMMKYSNLDPEKCEFVSIGQATDIPPGQRLFVDIDELSIVVFNLAEKFYAIADTCSHDNHPLGEGELEGLEIICPRHGARFDIRDGKAISLPAIVDIPSYPVRVNSGEIEVGIPSED
jgi:3-phenylpropionate/trans-cinnamate dioxygenase ferredoxin component